MNRHAITSLPRIRRIASVVALLTLATGGTQAQTLPVTSGLQLWLKADAGVTTNSSGLVSAWADQSPLGNTATQSDTTKSPTLVPNALNGRAVLSFPGGR